MRKRYLRGKWLAERARSTILLQNNPSFEETLDQVHFSAGNYVEKWHNIHTEP